jgi:hypothetical protein
MKPLPIHWSGTCRLIYGISKAQVGSYRLVIHTKKTVQRIFIYYKETLIHIESIERCGDVARERAYGLLLELLDKMDA